MRRRTMLIAVPLALVTGCGNSIVATEPPRTPTITPTGTPTTTPTPAIVVAATVVVTPTALSTQTIAANTPTAAPPAPVVVATVSATSTPAPTPTMPPAPTGGVQVVSVQGGGDPINVRSAPDSGSPVIALLGGDAEAPTIGTEVTGNDGTTKWVHVRAGSRDGYVRSDLVSAPHAASGPIAQPIFLATPAPANTPMTPPPPMMATRGAPSATTGPTMSAAFPTGKVGMTLVAANGTAVTLNAYRDPVPPAKYSQPKAGNRFIAVDVTVENRSMMQQSFNFFYGSMRDTEGHQFSAQLAGDIVSPAFRSGDNSPGDKARGWMLFEVPNNAQMATFRYEPFFEGRFIFSVA